MEPLLEFLGYVVLIFVYGILLFLVTDYYMRHYSIGFWRRLRKFAKGK